MRCTSSCFILGVALTLLPACSNSQSAQDTTVATSTSTTTSTTVLTITTTSITATTNLPATTIAKKKTTTTTQVPQMQLSGTPEEQLNQVVAATEKVAAFSLASGKWNQSLGRLNDSLASYGIRVRWDPNETGRNIYQITMSGQSTCFLWTYANSASDSRSLQPHSCS